MIYQNGYSIEIADLIHLEELVDHDIRHMQEPGFEGQLAHPFPPDHPWDREKMLLDKSRKWIVPVGEEFWSRSFVLIKDNKIVGHLNLKNKFFQSMHRAQLGMGLEESARGQGLGKLMMKTAIEWSQKQPFLDWIDLSVFAHNTPAIKLYKSFGFVDHYTFPDMLRVNGVSIADSIMTLKLRK